MKVHSIVLALWFLAGTGPLWAQGPNSGAPKSEPSVPQVSISPVPVVQPGGGTPFGGGGGGFGFSYSGAGSTIAGSAAAGMADLVRSSGYANLQNSAAAINYQQAARSSMENNWIAAEGYFQGRQMNKAYRDALAGPRPTQEDLVRYAKSGVPKRLSPSELDPLTGQIAWPALFKDPTYQADRKKLEMLVAQRAQRGQLGVEQRKELQQTADSLHGAMKKNINNYAPQDYVQAKKFLDQLTYELRLPPA
jgi:hypothetical protein